MIQPSSRPEVGLQVKVSVVLGFANLLESPLVPEAVPAEAVEQQALPGVPPPPPPPSSLPSAKNRRNNVFTYRTGIWVLFIITIVRIVPFPVSDELLHSLRLLRHPGHLFVVRFIDMPIPLLVGALVLLLEPLLCKLVRL